MYSVLRDLLKPTVVVAVLMLSATVVMAQHSDVEFSYAGGRIDVEFGEEGQVFEGEFDTEGTDLQFTSEPGFASELEEGLGIGAGDEIVYNVLGNLLVWDGAAISSAPDGTQLRIENRGLGVPDTVITGSSDPQPGSFVDPFNNRIGGAEDDGDFHSDLDWFLEPNPGSPAMGAYAVKLSLSTDAAGIAGSKPFFIVQNFGLSEMAFEEGVEAFAALVPEPTSMLIVGIGGCLLGMMRQRRDTPAHS